MDGNRPTNGGPVFDPRSRRELLLGSWTCLLLIDGLELHTENSLCPRGLVFVIGGRLSGDMFHARHVVLLLFDTTTDNIVILSL